jgi:hypothetical protein
MAQPIQPFLGGGGYGNVMAPSYQQVSRQVGDEYISRENAKVDSAQQALNSIIGMGAKAGGADPLMASKMLPSSINEYYAQASELDKKSNAMKKMLELNPEMFGLDKDQVKQLGDVTSKMSSTERSAFFQAYVPDLFKAQQAKLEQDAAYRRAVAAGGGGDSSLMYNNPSDVFQSYFSGTPTQPKSPPRAVPMGAQVQSAPPRAVPVSRGLDMNNMGFGQQEEVIYPY